jgi:hypothetical protein
LDFIFYFIMLDIMVSMPGSAVPSTGNYLIYSQRHWHLWIAQRRCF